jgi:hypothetical protein
MANPLVEATNKGEKFTKKMLDEFNQRANLILWPFFIGFTAITIGYSIY